MARGFKPVPQTLVQEIEARGIYTARDVPLSTLTRWRIGGPADVVVEPATEDEMAWVLKAVTDAGVPVMVIGDGSNLLMDSKGYRGVIVRVGRRLGQFDLEGTGLTCGAGVWVPKMAMRLARAGLTGLEHVVGIPGTLGGLVLMNGGSQRKGVGTHVAHIRVAKPDGHVYRMDQEALDFSYRSSSLQGSTAVITQVTLSLEKGDVATIRREMIEILTSRRLKFPKEMPNCGSTFLSNPKMYAVVGPPGKAIEDAGLKGVAIGGAQVAPQHANFIVNRGGATSDEVLALIAHIRATVLARTDYYLDCEARFVCENGEEGPAHEYTDAGRFDTRLLDQIDCSALECAR